MDPRAYLSIVLGGKGLIGILENIRAILKRSGVYLEFVYIVEG